MRPKAHKFRMNHDDLFRWARKCSSIGLFFSEVVSNGAVSPDRLIYLSFGECDQLLDACIGIGTELPKGETIDIHNFVALSTDWQKRMLAADALRSGQPLQSIPFAAVVVAGVDRRDSALLLSFIVCELWYGCCFLLSQSFVFPKKIVPVVSRSPDEAEIRPVFVF